MGKAGTASTGVSSGDGASGGIRSEFSWPTGFAVAAATDKSRVVRAVTKSFVTDGSSMVCVWQLTAKRQNLQALFYRVVGASGLST
jgi:hypothetical protein